MAIAYRLKNRLKSLFRKPWKALLRTPDRLTLIAARVALRIVPQIGIDRDILYPPTGVCASTEEWVSGGGRTAGADFRLVDPGYTANHLLPKTVHQQVRRQFLGDEVYPCPATFVARIPGGRVLGEGLIITPDNHLLDDISITFGAPLEPKLEYVRREWAWRPLTDVKGTVAVLSTAGAMLYYHWLFQLLPRFDLIGRSGIEMSSIDYFVVNSAMAPFQRESLEALGIDQRKIIESSRVPYLRASTLVVPSVPLGGGCYALWMREFLRNTFLRGVTMKRGQPSGGFTLVAEVPVTGVCLTRLTLFGCLMNSVSNKQNSSQCPLGNRLPQSRHVRSSSLLMAADLAISSFAGQQRK